MKNKIDENQFAELVEFVRAQTREESKTITRETLVEDDLGVTGDEVYDLIDAFSKKYNVDISEFDYGRYFYDEPGVFNLQNRTIHPFTIGHLEKAILAGRLDEVVINSQQLAIF